MPTSEFQTALSERIEFAVFVAYEQWVRASGYAAPNPYDVLARLLPGLPESLGAAVSARGGWGAFEPIGGMPADAARQLINEMASQVVSARVAALAPHAPDGNLLAQVIVDAVGRSVSVFIDDPESWRLALNPGERGQVAALGEPRAGPAGGDAGEGHADQALPPAATPTDEGGDYGAPGARVVQTIERVLPGGEASIRPDLSQFFSLSDLWLLKTSGTVPARDVAVGAISDLLIDTGSGNALQGLLSRELIQAASALGSSTALDDLSHGAGTGGTQATPVVPVSTPGGGSDTTAGHSPGRTGPTAGLPEPVALIIDRWIELLNKASFYRVAEDGSIQRLSEHEAQQVVDTLVSVLVRRAQLDLSLPALPGTNPTDHDHPATPATSSPPAAMPDHPATDTAGTPGHDPASGLGSDTLHLPPPATPTSEPGDTVSGPVLHASADPAPDGPPAGDVVDLPPTIIPPLDHATHDPWHA